MTLPPTSDPVSYTKLRATLKTGDLVFLHGISDAGITIENMEKLAGWPPYSHVGMVIKDGDNLYLWDAPGGGLCFPDPYAGDPLNRIYGQKIHTGCRVSQLDDVLAYYVTRVDDGGIFVRQLLAAVSPEQFAALRILINQVDGQPFPTLGDDPKTAPVKGIEASWGAGQVRSSTLFGSYFCAQLIADSYFRMGLLGMEDYPANGYSPAAFGMNDATRLPLKGVKLDDVEFVDFDWTQPTNPGIDCGQ